MNKPHKYYWYCEPGTLLRDIKKLPVIGAPPWVTVGLVCRTLNVWQKRYSNKLTVDDAIEMVISVGRLADALEEVA